MRTRTSSNGLPARLRTFAAREGLLPPGCRVLCAVSGGADSMALLTALRALAPDLGISVAAAHFDHRLRGAESDRDRAFVADWCARHEIPLRLGHGDVRAAAAAQGRGLEETARDLRYAFLETAAADLGCDRIATAHNADDNAETVLLHLVRGTGLDGLGGIPPRRGALIRPLLGCTRAEIEAYLAAEGVPHVEDSSNADPAYARNRIRRDVMPVLRDLNPAFAATLAAALPHLRADRAYLDDKAAAALPLRRDGAGVRLSAREFDVMRFLLQNKGRVLSKEMILSKVWGYDSNAVENHVEVYVGFLRKKLTSIGSDLKIEAIRRLGYHLEVAE